METNFLKRCVALSNVTIEQVSSEIETIDAGENQETTASQVFRISKEGEVPAKYDALIYYKVNKEALKYKQKELDLPDF